MRSVSKGPAVRVIGIDPGLTTMGYGVIERAGGRVTAVAWGALRTSAADPLAARLCYLREGLLGLVAEHRPATAAAERVFFNANVRTAISVGQASGVALAALAEAGLEVAHYTPTEVKSSVCGHGAAGKIEVGRMVARTLGLDAAPAPADAADALALALCYFNRSGLMRAIKEAQG